MSIPELARDLPRRRRTRRVWPARLALLGPGTAWWLVFFLVPAGVLVVYSFFERGPYGGVVYDWTLDPTVGVRVSPLPRSRARPYFSG